MSRIEELEELTAMDPGDPLGFFMLGREYFKGEQFAKATEAFQRVLELEPKYTAAYRQLGDACVKAGRRDEAIAAYRQGIEVARETRDLQAGKECAAFLKRLGVTPPAVE